MRHQNPHVKHVDKETQIETFNPRIPGKTSGFKGLTIVVRVAWPPRGHERISEIYLRDSP